ncbi:Uncharacterised protein [Bordetella pertussis]|nr:Uncharacterised protein [Bordetella pertussis]CFO07573.1 Uncharacterised protein [Bordetella pertussis]CFP13604.1 Uncharacterised protein [Bordetella pertussis]CPJ50148.1 Uncharacterised protein [Bordetella pertussis]CPJ81547.1 Uncharacterised protein [Bordetella pertussis]
MVWPDMLVTTSPGLLALPLGRFSHAAIRPTTSSGSSSSARARNVPSTLAAPHMSYFISSIVAAGLSEMPPASKVMPLPTRTTGPALSFLAGLPAWRSTMKRSGSSEPRATERNEPMPSASTCLRSSTSTLRLLNSRASFLAVLPR